MWIDAISEFLGGEPPKKSGHFADQWRFQIDCTLCSFQYMKTLMGDSPQVDEFWEWTRRAYQYGNNNWRAADGRMQDSSPELVNTFVEQVLGHPSVENNLLNAGRDVLLFFGMGIKQLRGEMPLQDDSKSPRLEPALAELFN